MTMGKLESSGLLLLGGGRVRVLLGRDKGLCKDRVCVNKSGDVRGSMERETGWVASVGGVRKIYSERGSSTG